MPRSDIIDLIVTEHFPLYTLVTLPLWQRNFLQNGRMYSSIYLLVSSVVLIVKRFCVRDFATMKCR